MRRESRRKFIQCFEKKIDIIINSIKGRKLYVYGAGEGGKVLVEELENRGISIDGIYDRALESEGVCFRRYKVVEKNELSPDSCYVIVSLLCVDVDIIEFMQVRGFRDNDWCYLYDTINQEDIVYKGIKIGKYTYGYEDLLKDCPLATSIGRYCSINGTARIWNNHPLDFLTTSPILDYPNFFVKSIYDERKKLIRKYSKYFDNAPYEDSPLRENRPVIIGNDVWIGAYVSVLPGVIIGDGAIIGAGAVVTKDIEPYAVVGGVPAKVIKYRYAKEEIEILLRIKWWEWSDEELKNNIELLYNPKMFFEKFRI